MSQFLKRMLGIVYVSQEDNVIEIGGAGAANLMRDIKAAWGTSKIEGNMFLDMSKRSIKFRDFYAIEIHYMLQELLKQRRNWTPRNTILAAIKAMEENTWLAGLADKENFPRIFDRTKLKLFKKTPMKHQLEFFDVYEYGRTALGLHGYLLSAAAGSGKAQPLSSLIKTPDGWMTMGEAQVGSVVTAWDGSETRITGVYPQGVKDVYEITFKDGRTARSCGEHLWRVYDNRQRPERPGYCQVIDTLAMKDRLEQGHRVHIDLMTPDAGSEVQLPVDPYLLGVLIGDGSTASGSIAITKNDAELFDTITPLLPEGVGLVQTKDERALTYRLTRTDMSVKKNPLTEILRDLGLFGLGSHERFIPNQYKNGSLQQRLSILQGLFDTDGTVSGGTITYCTTSEKLALDVQDLIWSVGGIASVTSRQTYYTYGEERRAGRLSYLVNVRIKRGGDLFRLARKRERTNDDNQYAQNLKLAVVKVEKVSEEPCQCISIDHPDRLYITDNFVVTHNTLTNLFLAEMVHSDYIVIVSPNNAVYRVWDKTVREEYVKPQIPWIAGEKKPYKGERILITHYEGLPILMSNVGKLNGKVTVILDESHNFNEMSSQRTQTFIDLCERVKSENVLWSSGTPIKALGGECVPLLKTIDPRFTPDVEKGFRAIFGVNAKRALDVLRNRMGFISYRVEKKDVVDNKPVELPTVKVKLPNGEDYTLDSIRQQMKDFIAERLEYYKKNYSKYEDIYENCLRDYEDAIATTQERSDYKTYRTYIEKIKKYYDPKEMKEEAMFCNNFELKFIMPKLNIADRKAFKGARSVIKYVHLKVMGEALGSVVGKSRSRCHLEMLPHIPFDAIMDKAQKKTVIFTSYVPVVEELQNVLTKLGKKPLLVYGKTNKDLATNVGAFETDPSVDPLCATYPSLSTAVPLVMADLAIFLNSPFRDHELVQAKARIDRLGQDTPVKFQFVTLDTGDEPNISTRSADILEWSKQQVAMIMGSDYSGDAAKTLEGYFTSMEDYEDDPHVISMEAALNDYLGMGFISGEEAEEIESSFGVSLEGFGDLIKSVRKVFSTPEPKKPELRDLSSADGMKVKDLIQGLFPNLKVPEGTRFVEHGLVAADGIYDKLAYGGPLSGNGAVMLGKTIDNTNKVVKQCQAISAAIKAESDALLAIHKSFEPKLADAYDKEIGVDEDIVHALFNKAAPQFKAVLNRQGPAKALGRSMQLMGPDKVVNDNGTFRQKQGLVRSPTLMPALDKAGVEKALQFIVEIVDKQRDVEFVNVIGYADHSDGSLMWGNLDEAGLLDDYCELCEHHEFERRYTHYNHIEDQIDQVVTGLLRWVARSIAKIG
jgi:hypothetical protein